MKNAQGTTKHLIDSKNLPDFEEKTNTNSINTTFNNLLSLLDMIINQMENNNADLYEIGYKILDYLDEVIIHRENEKINLKKVIKQKTRIIEGIKEVKKENRINNKRITFYKEVTNRLENIEINVEHNIKSDEIIENYNIIKYIILNEKNINYAEILINKYFYLINAHNMLNNNSLIDNIIDEFLKALEEYALYNKVSDLYYFDNVLDRILNNSKIKIEPEVRERNIKKIMNKFNSLKLDKKEREKISSWYHHLIKLIDTNSSRVSLEQLNNMYNIKFYFKTATLEEANIFKYSNKYKMIAKPSEDYIITIDEKETNLDKDDAISIKKHQDGYELKVYIADPNTFCTMNSLLMQEARNRTQSIYLPDKTIHMFPEELLLDNLSLNENKNRYARVYTYIISEHGEIIDFNIEKKAVRVSNNLSYDKVNETIKKGTENIKLNTTIQNLLDLKNIISKKYVSQEELEKSSPKEKSKSESLIELLMVFNNYKVAEYFYKHNLPFIYRNHKLNKSLTDFEKDIEKSSLDNDKFQKIIASIENVCLSASYSCENPNHEQLDLEYYSHTTSPLRRYADVIANHCQDNFYFSRISDEEAYAFEENLKNEVSHINEKEKEIFEYYKRYARIMKKPY